MASKLLKTIALLVLLTSPSLGQNCQKHLICKRVESIFADTQDCVKEKPGSPAIVDYERIYEATNDAIRRGTCLVMMKYYSIDFSYVNSLFMSVPYPKGTT